MFIQVFHLIVLVTVQCTHWFACLNPVAYMCNWCRPKNHRLTNLILSTHKLVFNILLHVFKQQYRRIAAIGFPQNYYSCVYEMSNVFNVAFKNRNIAVAHLKTYFLSASHKRLIPGFSLERFLSISAYPRPPFK